MEFLHIMHPLRSLKIPEWERVRKPISSMLTIIGIWTMYRVYSHHWDPLSYLLIGFFIVLLILPFLGLGCDGIRIVLLSSVAVALAAFVLPYVYLGILFPIAVTVGPGPYLFILVACVLAPIFEELAKGSLWFLERGGWRYGAAVGLGFGCFEATSYLMVFGVDIAFLRWQGTILHVVTTALMFEGLNSRKWRLIVGSIGLHMLHNGVRILVVIW